MRNKSIEEISNKVIGKQVATVKVTRLSKAALIFFITVLTIFMLAFIFVFGQRNTVFSQDEHQENMQTADAQLQESWYGKKLATLLAPADKVEDKEVEDYADLYPGSGTLNDDSEPDYRSHNSILEQKSTLASEDVDKKIINDPQLSRNSNMAQARYAPLTGTIKRAPIDPPPNTKVTGIQRSAIPDNELSNLQEALLGEHAATDQQEKLDFLQHTTAEVNELLLPEKNSSTLPRLSTGTIIPAILISGINSDLPGVALAQVRQAVYDSRYGVKEIIPVGTKILLNYDSKIVYGQKRILLVAMRLMFPDGRNFSMQQMPVVDASGLSGFHDQVDPHYARIFSSAIALGVISAGLQLGQPQHDSSLQTLSSGQVIAGAVTQNFGEVASQTISKNLAVQPTLNIRPGYLFNIILSQDIVFKNSN